MFLSLRYSDPKLILAALITVPAWTLGYTSLNSSNGLYSSVSKLPAKLVVFTNDHHPK